MGWPAAVVDLEARTKVCGKCGETKSFDDFGRLAKGKHGLAAYCKQCKAGYMRAYGQEYYYRLTPERRAEILIAQSGRCAICVKPLTADYHVDHDHSCCPSYKSGRTCGECVRGFLCGPCNRGIGQFEDDVDLLVAAIAYLRQHGKVSRTS